LLSIFLFEKGEGISSIIFWQRKSTFSPVLVETKIMSLSWQLKNLSNYKASQNWGF